MMDMMDESLEKKNTKNPMMLSPVIRCVLKFLNIDEIKNCRLVSREWGSIGKPVLASNALIHFTKYKQYSHPRLPVDFHSCFLNSATLFSAFKISSYMVLCRNKGFEPWTYEELTKFFDQQEKYTNELTLSFNNGRLGNVDLSSWISKSPMVQKDTKDMTKLSIQRSGSMFGISLHLIANVKDLTFSCCTVNLDEGIRICPIKLKLANATFLQNGIELDQVIINDFVDLSKAKEVSLLHSVFQYATKYVLDLQGSIVLENLILDCCEIVNGESSQWVIERLTTKRVPYSLHSQMQIKELCLFRVGPIDLFTLPTSIQKLALIEYAREISVRCSRPVVLENLQYLNVSIKCGTYCHWPLTLSHFMNCPQLIHLKLNGSPETELKAIWLPKNVKTLKLEDVLINWVEDSNLNLEKLVVELFTCAYQFYAAKHRLEDLVLYPSRLKKDKYLVEFLENQKRFSFCKRLYIGRLKWGEKKLEDSLLKDYVDVQSGFYVFESKEKGRAISEKAFFELIPKRVDCES